MSYLLKMIRNLNVYLYNLKVLFIFVDLG